MKQSKNLTKFYKRYYKWAKKGGKQNNKYNFDDYTGMCVNVEEMFSHRERTEMRDQFVAAGLSEYYPFGEANYDDCSDCGGMHKDQNRLRWVKKHRKRNVKRTFKNK